MDKKTNSNPDKITVAVWHFVNYHKDNPRNIVNKGLRWSDWKLVKSAKPQFLRQFQPDVPTQGYTDEKDHQVGLKN